MHAVNGLCMCSANTALEDLDLGNKGLGVAGVRALQQALAARDGLNRLIISGNQLGDEGAEALAPAVPLIEQASECKLAVFEVHASPSLCSLAHAFT